jgi:hypothetical protein
VAAAAVVVLMVGIGAMFVMIDRSRRPLLAYDVP